MAWVFRSGLWGSSFGFGVGIGCVGSWILGLRFGNWVWGLGFGVLVWSLELWSWGVEFYVWDSGFWVLGLCFVVCVRWLVVCGV